MKKKRTAKPTTQAPVPQPAFRSILVRQADGTVHTYYLSDHGARRIDELTATGKTINDAIAAVVPGYITPYAPAQTEQAPACIVDLGLSWPCSLDDVRHAWRQLAKTHHPDHEGDGAVFIAKRKSYEEALYLLGNAGGAQ